MIDVIFPVERSYVRSPQSTTALVTEQPESAEVVCLAERILASAILVIGREEFRGYDLAAVLRSISTDRAHGRIAAGSYSALKAIQVEGSVESAHKLPRQRLSALLACAHLAASCP